jgi:butyrate kinase
MDAVQSWLAERPGRIDAVAAIGGLVKPLQGGTYRVSPAMIRDARANLQGEHVSNLGCAMAAEIAAAHGCEPFTVDPVSVDEFDDVARYSGHPLIERRTLSHALNIHASARRAAGELGVPFANARLIVAHLGGGISVAPVRSGRIIDVNDANSDGPFSPERTGGLPLQQFISLCFSGRYTEAQIRRLVRGEGGLMAYLGTSDLQAVEQRIENGEEEPRRVLEAMTYQIAKEIGAMATVLRGDLHAIVLTGGLASSSSVVAAVAGRVRFLAPVLVYPGEDEMQALALGVLRVLRGMETARAYEGDAARASEDERRTP